MNRRTNKKKKNAHRASLVRVRFPVATNTETKPTQRSFPIRFVLLFGAIAIPLMGAYFFPYPEVGYADRWLQYYIIYLSAYARLVGVFISLFDPTVIVSDSVISGRFSMMMVKHCDAMSINVLLVAATAAYPAPLARKAVVIPLALSAIVFVNITRLVSIYLAGIHFPTAFDFFHLELWPLVMVVAATLIFLCAIWLMTPSAPRHQTG